MPFIMYLESKQLNIWRDLRLILKQWLPNSGYMFKTKKVNHVLNRYISLGLSRSPCYFKPAVK